MTQKTDAALSKEGGRSQILIGSCGGSRRVGGGGRRAISTTCTALPGRNLHVQEDSVPVLSITIKHGRSYCNQQHRVQHAQFIPLVGVGKRGAYELVHGDLPRQHSFGTTLRVAGPVPVDSR